MIWRHWPQPLAWSLTDEKIQTIPLQMVSSEATCGFALRSAAIPLSCLSPLVVRAMTIQKEAPGIWIAVCDFCNTRHELDTDPDDSFHDAVWEVKNKGWKFHHHTRGGWTHKCVDCVEDETLKEMREAGL